MIKPLNNFIEANKNIFPDLSLKFCDKPFNFFKDHAGQQVEFADKKGLFFFAFPNDEIILLGKSKTTIGESVSKHQNDVNELVKNKYPENNFYIYTVRVRPAYYTPLMEAFALTTIFAGEGRLPVLNSKIG